MHRNFFAGAVCILAMLMFIRAASADTSSRHALSLTSGPASCSNITITKTGNPSGQNDNYDLQDSSTAILSDNGAGAITVTTTALKPAIVGKSYTMTLKASGDKPISWSAQNLPEGLSISAKGTISGKPKTAGSCSVIFSAANAKGTGSAALALNVLNIAPKLKVTSKSGEIDEYYSNTFTLTQGTGNIIWTLTGNLPEGLSFDANTAVLGGVPSAAWKDYITVTASNDAGSASKRLMLVIKSIQPATTTKSIASGVVNKYYSSAINLAGSRTITVNITGLPAGLDYEYSADKKAVIISGIPTESGKFSARFTAQNDGGKLLKIYKFSVNQPPVIDTVTLAEGISGKNYSKKFTAEGTRKITWSITSGDLPSGITLNASNGTLKGKTNYHGIFPFTVTAKNDYGADSVDAVLTISPAAPKISGNVKNGTAGSAYSSVLRAKGSVPMYWNISGDLPDGITFSNGAFSGTSTRYFKGNITVIVSNDGGQDSKTFSLEIKAAAPKITTVSLASGTQGKEYSAVLKATGTPDIVWNWTGNPAGLVLSADTGRISGIPTESGTFKVNISAANISKTARKTFKLVIASGSSPAVQEVSGYPHAERNGFSREYYGSTEDLPEGYIIAAELPEVSADEDGMRDFAVTLGENAPIGAKLYWISNSEEPSNDDAIAEFFGADGLETAGVPEDRKIIVSAWLNRGVIYRPVIAVKKQ